MTEGPNQDETARIRELIMGFRSTQLIYVATKLELSEHLARGPLTAQEVASTIGVDAGALYRLLRALASLGIFSETTGGRFKMTPAATLLQRNTPKSLRSTAMIYGDEVLWRAYGQMTYAIKTGRPAFQHVHGQPFYDYLGEHPRSADLFNDAMTGFSDIESSTIVAVCEVSQIRTVVDVGGGQGALMAALLRAHPHLQAVIFDSTGPTADTERNFAAADIAGRARFIQGDFFASIPDEGELYFLKSILHNWDDSAAAAILRKCREAMPKHARLVIAERVISLGNLPSESKLFDVNMLVTTGGRERTEAEYASLLSTAGLKLTKVTPTTSYLSLVEGIKAVPLGPETPTERTSASSTRSASSSAPRAARR